MREAGDVDAILFTGTPWNIVFLRAFHWMAHKEDYFVRFIHHWRFRVFVYCLPDYNSITARDIQWNILQLVW